MCTSSGGVARPLPDRGDGRERYMDRPGEHQLPPPPLDTGMIRWEAWAPVVASTAEGP